MPTSPTHTQGLPFQRIPILLIWPGTPTPGTVRRLLHPEVNTEPPRPPVLYPSFLCSPFLPFLLQVPQSLFSNSPCSCGPHDKRSVMSTQSSQRSIASRQSHILDEPISGPSVFTCKAGGVHDARPEAHLIVRRGSASDPCA